MTLEVLAAVSIKVAVFWDVTLCGLVHISKRDGGRRHFHLQGTPSEGTQGLTY
jgi:hypothetical protein